MQNFFGELKRRNVVRVGIAYIVIGWLTFQLGEIILPTFGAPDWIFKTLIFLVALGFPFALLFAWAFELTPDGVKKTEDVNVATSVTASTGRKLDFVIIAALVVALAYFVWERQSVDETSVPIAASTVDASTVEPEKQAASDTVKLVKSRSIAVLPFVNMSADKSHEWFSDGLTEEILNSLARTPDLLVAARTSSFAYKSSTKDVPTIAAELGVDNILEGSVRRDETRLRVTAQLIRAADGFHLWSETFDRDIDDMIAIQENVAIEIAKALETAMDPEALAAMVSSGTHSIPAYEAYLKGLAFGVSSVSTGDTYEYIGARDAFEKAIELDPEFASAYWQLAQFWGELLGSANISYGVIEMPADEMLSRFDDAVAKAIEHERDPVSKLKYRSLGAAVNSRLSQALRLNTDYLAQRPNDHDAQFMRLNLLQQLGMVDQIAPTIEEYVERDGYNSVVGNQIILASLHVADPEFIRSVTLGALERIKDDVFVAYQAHRALLWTGDIDGASRLVNVVQTSDLPASVRLLVSLRQACAENRTDDAAAMVEQISRTYSNDLFMVWIGLRMMSKDEEAVEVLRPLDEKRDFATLIDFLAYSYFDPRPYPNLMAFLETEDATPREPARIPYRCNR